MKVTSIVMIVLIACVAARDSNLKQRLAKTAKKRCEGQLEEMNSRITKLEEGYTHGEDSLARIDKTVSDKMTGFTGSLDSSEVELKFEEESLGEMKTRGTKLVGLLNGMKDDFKKQIELVSNRMSCNKVGIHEVK